MLATTLFCKQYFSTFLRKMAVTRVSSSLISLWNLQVNILACYIVIYHNQVEKGYGEYLYLFKTFIKFFLDHIVDINPVYYSSYKFAQPSLFDNWR